jgi:hypothetical protein
MELTMNMLKLKDHLTNATMPESYAEAVDGITPADRWCGDDATTKLYIAASLPTPSFKSAQNQPPKKSGMNFRRRSGTNMTSAWP